MERRGNCLTFMRYCVITLNKRIGPFHKFICNIDIDTKSWGLLAFNLKEISCMFLTLKDPRLQKVVLYSIVYMYNVIWWISTVSTSPLISGSKIYCYIFMITKRNIILFQLMSKINTSAIIDRCMFLFFYMFTRSYTYNQTLSLSHFLLA